MNFSTAMDPAVWIIFSVAALAAIIGLWTRFLPIWAAGLATGTEENDDEDDTLRPAPSLSVIVYTFTEQEELDSYLDILLSQDYPDYEVVLVNEGSAETTAMLAEQLGERFGKRIYVTFIPHDAHNLSRRKLAYTVGIKAAKGKVVLTTASNCRIPSTRWLSDMMRPFREDSLCEIVLGFTHIDFNDLHGAGKWYRQMDYTLTSCQWIGSARLGKPYRGDCFNLAYLRSRFFEQKGYSRTIQLVNGDDDIFLRPFMEGDNTAVVVSHDSILTSEWGDSANRILAETKARYQFTADYLPRLPFIRAGIGSLMQWVTLLGAAAAVWLGLPSVTPAVVAGIFIAVLWISQILIYRRAARRLEAVCLWWSLPVFLLWHPIGNLIFRLRRRSQRRKNYTFA